MKKFALVSWTAIVPASLAAQTVEPPSRWADVPAYGMNVPAAAAAQAAPGVSWRGAAPMAPRMAPQMHARPTPPAMTHRPGMRPPQHPGMRPPHHAMRPPHHPGMRPPVVGRPNPGMHHRFPHIRRINRGHFVPQFWWGPQFHVQNWGLYGFSQPYEDTRWIRYYDDAYLIDREGRVRDGRYGLDWDRYGERWDYERGIPEYVGDGDFQPDDRDYAWVEGSDERYAEAEDGDQDYAEDNGEEYGEVYEQRAEKHHGRSYEQHVAYPGGCQPPPPGYYSCGYGYGYPVVITETTVTTAPRVTVHTVYKDVTVKHRPKAKPYYRPKPKRYRSPPPYTGGEKG